MSQQPISKVIAIIRFQLLPPKDVRKLSAGQVMTDDIYDEDGLPLSGGLMDARLGPTAPGQRCATCGNSEGACPGHFGHIELARPVVHVGFARRIQFALRYTCWRCHRLLLTEASDPLHPEHVRDLLQLGQELGAKPTLQDSVRKVVLEGGTGGVVVRRKLKAIKKLLLDPVRLASLGEEVTEEDLDPTCPYCSATPRKVTRVGPTTFYEEEEGKGMRYLPPLEIQDHLEKISDEDCWCLGINPEVNRPEWMILRVLPVPPPCVRPSITLDSGIRSEDDLTHKLVDVIHINQRLKENIDAGAPPLIVDDLWELLQYHVTTYFNNQTANIPPTKHRSGQPLKTLTQRLEGKEGRVRSNLSAKRVNFCARTVISPAPHLGINKVGVPERIAKILTVPSRVTEGNIEAMKQLVINGPQKHPGANYLVRPDGRRISLGHVKHLRAVAGALKAGSIVERHLDDGDIVLFNRQPSLHRMSIMAHETVVVPGKTFRVPMPTCTPYNADFDGDEMNLHVPQGEEARAEATHLLKVQHHLISPRSGLPVMGCIEDHVSMAYLLTRHDAYFTRGQTCQLLYHGNVFERNPGFQLDRDLKPRITKPAPLYRGKDIFSTLIPKGINISARSKFCLKCKPCVEEDCPFDAYVVVRDGQLLRGTIDKATLGALQGTSLLQHVVRGHGFTRGRQFLDDAVQLLLAMLPMMGLTMGLDEVDVQGPALQEIGATLEDSREIVDKFIQAYLDKDETTLQPVPGMTLVGSLEARLTDILGKARNRAGDIAADYLGDQAHSVIMTKSGARGNPLNLAQMAACVGQQSVRGARIHRGYSNRTLPHFREADLSPVARGFVNSSYRKGLNPIEFFFHAMGGREGLVDTATRTSTSGYLQRRLINAMQDLVVAQDLTVRDSRGNIVQFKYGDDGIDPAKSDHGMPIDLDALLVKARSIDGGSPQDHGGHADRPPKHHPRARRPTVVQENPEHVIYVTNLVAHALKETHLSRVIPPDTITTGIQQAVLQTNPDLTSPVLMGIAREQDWKPFTLRKKVRLKMKALRSHVTSVDLSRLVVTS